MQGSNCYGPWAEPGEDWRQGIRFSWPPRPFAGSRGLLEEMAIGRRSANPLAAMSLSVSNAQKSALSHLIEVIVTITFRLAE